ncbi:hypothetical protein EDD86DRAFT_204539 [Gorgonomyces haynaldii]|nr:hypothetical protein EDD86DRAFT_204539 [Gorgonomyces haynaldii]
MSRLDNAFLFPASVMLGIGFYEYFNLLSIFWKNLKTYKSPVFVLGFMSMLFAIPLFAITTVALDHNISPYPEPPGLRGTKALLVAVFSSLSHLCTNSMAFLLLWAFFKTQKTIWIWAVVFGICQILRIVLIYLSFPVFVPFATGIYSGIDFAVNPEYLKFSTCLTAIYILETVYMIAAVMTFIMNIVAQLMLPAKAFLLEFLTEYGGFRYFFLIFIRLVGTALLLKPAITQDADASTTIVNYFFTLQLPWSIYVVMQTAFFIPKALMDKVSHGQSMPSSGLRSGVRPVAPQSL